MLDDATLRIVLTAAGSSFIAVLAEKLRAKRAKRPSGWREDRSKKVRIAFYWLGLKLRRQSIFRHLELELPRCRGQIGGWF